MSMVAEWSEDRLSTSWEHTTSVQLHTGTWASSWRWSFGELSIAISLMSLRFVQYCSWFDPLLSMSKDVWYKMYASRLLLPWIWIRYYRRGMSLLIVSHVFFRFTSLQWNLIPVMTWMRRCLYKRFAALVVSGPLSTSHVCMLRALCVMVLDDYLHVQQLWCRVTWSVHCSPFPSRIMLLLQTVLLWPLD